MPQNIKRDAPERELAPRLLRMSCISEAASPRSIASSSIAVLDVLVLRARVGSMYYVCVCVFVCVCV
jgi:hypothetical protein